jgi:hypothetical protein
MIDWLSRPNGRKLLTPKGPDGIFADHKCASIETMHGIRELGDTLREAIGKAMATDKRRLDVARAVEKNKINASKKRGTK